MNRRLATALFVIASVATPMTAFAADSDADRSQVGTYVKDSVITTKIKAKLAEEHLGSMDHIKVDTDNSGIVWMTGTANTQEEVNRAVTIAKTTEGVKSVNSKLTVQKDR
jgi:hyperosmotically inducible protein